MEELKDIEIINRYLDGILSDSEKKSVEKRLGTDTSFQKTFEEVNEAILAVQLAAEDRVKAILREEQSKFSVKKVIQLEKTTSKPFILRGWLAAASVAILAIAGYWFFIKDANNNEEFAFMHKPNIWIKVERDTNTALLEKQRVIAQYGEVNGEKLLEGISLYQNEIFDKAAQVLLSINLQNDTLSLYQANALIKANDVPQAIRILEKISKQSPSKDEKNWYLAMAYLQTKDIDKAKEILTDLSKNGSPEWQIEAQKVYKKLHL